MRREIQKIYDKLCPHKQAWLIWGRKGEPNRKTCTKKEAEEIASLPHEEYLKL